MATPATTRKTRTASQSEASTQVKVPPRYVLVGYKTLSAPLVKPGDPIRYGEVVEVEGEALEWVKKAVYIDGDGFECDVFALADSEEGMRAIAIASGDAPPPRPVRRRPGRRSARRQ